MPDTWPTFTEYLLLFFHNIWAILSFVYREQSFFNCCYCHLGTDFLLKPPLVIMVICPHSQERTLECSLTKELNRKIPLLLSYLQGKVNVNQVSLFMKVISSSLERKKKKSLSLPNFGFSSEDKDLIPEVVTVSWQMIYKICFRQYITWIYFKVFIHDAIIFKRWGFCSRFENFEI